MTLASLVIFTDGRACRPTSWVTTSSHDRCRQPCCRRQCSCGDSSSAVRFTSSSDRSAPGFGRRHHRALDDRAHCRRRPCRAAARAAASRPPSRCSSPHRRDRRGWPPPCPTRRSSIAFRIFSTLVPRPPSGLPPQIAERHVLAHHLAHHVGRASGDVGRMRHDDDADLVAHLPASSTSQTASIMSCARAGARIHVADRALAQERGASATGLSSATVAAARSCAIDRMTGSRSSPAATAPAIGPSTSSMVFLPTSDLAARLERQHGGVERPARLGGGGRRPELLAERHQQGAVERTRRPADLHDAASCRRIAALPAAVWRRLPACRRARHRSPASC